MKWASLEFRRISNGFSKESLGNQIDQIDQDTCIGTRIIQIYVCEYFIHFKELSTKKAFDVLHYFVYDTMLFDTFHILLRAYNLLQFVFQIIRRILLFFLWSSRISNLCFDIYIILYFIIRSSYTKHRVSLEISLDL